MAMSRAEAGRLGGLAHRGNKGGSKTLKKGLVKKDPKSGNTGWGGTTKSKAVKGLKKQVAGQLGLSGARKFVKNAKQTGQLQNIINR